MSSTNGHGPDPVALYLRVSSEEQRVRETIEIQEEFLGGFHELYGLEVAEVYRDDGVSGTIPLHGRPEGRRLLKTSERHQGRLRKGEIADDILKLEALRNEAIQREGSDMLPAVVTVDTAPKPSARLPPWRRRGH